MVFWYAVALFHDEQNRVGGEGGGGRGLPSIMKVNRKTYALMVFVIGASVGVPAAAEKCFPLS